MRNKKIQFFGFLISLLCLFGLTAPSVFAAASFYNKADDTMPDGQCNTGDFRLSPAITFGNAASGVGVTYNCVAMPEGSILLGAQTVRPASGCPARYGGLDLGGFGFHCLSNNTSDPMYVGTPSTNNNATPGDSGAPGGTTSNLEVDEDGEKILGWIQDGLNFLSAVAGLAITAMIIVGGIQYTTAGGNPQGAVNAKKRISNALLALVALVFLYTFLQWLVPGGIFS